MNIRLNPAFWFWLPLTVAVLSFLPAFFWRERHVITVLRVISLGFVVLALLLGAQWAWLLRDGLGPGAITSSGLESVRRFLGGFWLPLVISVVFALLVTLVSRRWLAALPRSHDTTS